MRVAFLLGLLLVVAAPFALGQEANNSTTNESTTNSTAPTNTTGNETPSAPAPIEFTLEGHSDGGNFYWTVVGQSARNPDIRVEPGQVVTFHVKSVGGLHDLKIGSESKIKSFDDTSGTIDVTWTAPTEPGTVTYICTFHGAGMSGKIVVGSAGEAPVGGGAGAINGEQVDLADLKDKKTGATLFPQCAGKGVMIPAIAAEGVTGGDTPTDYAKKCAATVTTDPYKNVDYVIPISFALIGAGVVAMVWVHRSYKP